MVITQPPPKPDLPITEPAAECTAVTKGGKVFVVHFANGTTIAVRLDGCKLIKVEKPVTQS